MPFKKGQSGNPSGNKGPHKKTKEWEALGAAIMGKQADRFAKALANLKDEKFVSSYIQVLEYFQPKQQRTENLHEVEGLTVNIIRGDDKSKD